jgi:hypothetical protein
LNPKTKTMRRRLYFFIILILAIYLLFSCGTTDNYGKYKIEKPYYTTTFKEDVRVKVNTNSDKLTLKFNNRVEKYTIRSYKEIYSESNDENIGFLVILDNGGVYTSYYNNFSKLQMDGDTKLLFSKY